MGILQFKADKTAYLESAEKADREDNPLQAMALLRRAEELDPHDFDIKSRMAAVLIGMGLPDIAEDLLFSYVACERKPPREAYLLLLHLLLDGGEYLLAEGVITETVGAGDDPMALLTELYGLIEKERYEGPNLRLLGDGYTLNRVEELAAAGKREEAERTARTLAHCPALLTEGLRTVAVYACLDGDTDDAERLGLELIGNNPADAYAAAVLLAVCREREDAPAAERYRALAARVEPRGERDAEYLDDLMRLAGGPEAAVYFEKRLAVEPYDGDLMLTLAELYANEGRCMRARRLLSDLLSVYAGDSAAQYLAQRLSDAEEGVPADPPYDITLGLQPDEQARRLATIAAWLAAGRSDKAAARAAYADPRIAEAVGWLFQSDRWELQAASAGILAEHAKGRKLLREQLMTEIPPLLKRDYVYYLLRQSPDRNVALITCGTFKIVCPDNRTVAGPLPEVYWLAYATLAVYDEDEEEIKLLKAYAELTAAYNDAVHAAAARMSEYGNRDVLTALLLYLSRIGPFRSQDESAAAAHVRRKALKEYHSFYILGRYENDLERKGKR